MPGAFAHITLVNMLKETKRLDALGGFPDAVKAAALKYFKYCEYGTVSPDGTEKIAAASGVQRGAMIKNRSFLSTLLMT